jgi:hypothetical protein
MRLCVLELVGNVGEYLNYACLRCRPVRFFLQLEPVVTAFFYLEFSGFGSDRSEL